MPTLLMVQKGVSASFMTPLISLLIILGAYMLHSLIAYLAIPVILIPYIVHMIVTRFDTKPAKVLSRLDEERGLIKLS